MSKTMTDWFPAGKYYVGDLCYVMHEKWDEVCEVMFAGRTDHGCNQGELKLKDGTRFVSFNTAHGDGGYYDNRGREYSVDAGLIGLIALDKIDLTNNDNDAGGGQIVEFKMPFDCASEDGMLRFGNVMIDTDTGDYMFDYEDEDYDCDSED